MKDTCIMTFMRCQPVHIGHGILFSTATSLQEQLNADLKIVLSNTTDDYRNILPPELKMYYTEGFYPSIENNVSTDDNVFQVLQELDGKYLDLYFVCGSDRVESFQNVLDKYNGKLYNFCNIKAVQAGVNRDNSQYSSTQMRYFAMNDDFENFSSFLPGNDEYLKMKLFKDCIKYMRKT